MQQDYLATTLSSLYESTILQNIADLSLCWLSLRLQLLSLPWGTVGRAMSRWAEISILSFTGCYSVNGSMLIKCSEDFCLHLLLIKINEALKQAQAFGVLLRTPSTLHEQGERLI